MTRQAQPVLPYLFNFAVAASGGGMKRLHEYSRLLSERGGAWFVAHRGARYLEAAFPENRYFFPSQSRLERLFDDCGYLPAIIAEMGRPTVYHAYGIPLYGPIGTINWFHLSNVLTLDTRDVPLDLILRLKMLHMGRLTKRGLQWADVISAESQYSLSLMPREYAPRLFLSVNGSDDELEGLSTPNLAESDPTLVVMVGTHVYKGLDEGVRVFEALRQRSPELRLEIVGDARTVPRRVRHHPGVVLRGALPRMEVIRLLTRAQFYISMTHIENSWNAASEGVFLARESYLSPIGPHRELLHSLPVEELIVTGVRTPVLRVRRAELSGVNLRSWKTVVDEMIARVRAHLDQRAPHGR